GGKEDSRSADFVRLADAPQKRLRNLPVVKLITRLGGDARLNGSRANRIYADVVRSVVVRDAAREPDQRSLNRAVGNRIARSRQRLHRGYVDDRSSTLANHPAKRLAREMPRAHQRDGNAPFPFLDGGVGKIVKLRQIGGI